MPQQKGALSIIEQDIEGMLADLPPPEDRSKQAEAKRIGMGIALCRQGWSMRASSDRVGITLGKLSRAIQSADEGIQEGKLHEDMEQAILELSMEGTIALTEKILERVADKVNPMEDRDMVPAMRAIRDTVGYLRSWKGGKIADPSEGTGSAMAMILDKIRQGELHVSPPDPVEEAQEVEGQVVEEKTPTPSESH